MSENPNPLDLAGASQPERRVEPDVDTAREVFPVRFEKDYLDFRGTEAPEEEVLAPKSSSAPVSVGTPKSPTGLEDVSEDDLESPVPTNAERDKNPTTTTPTVST